MQEEDIENRTVLKYYLKDFFIYFSEDEQNIFESKLEDMPNTCLIKANDYIILRKIMCYILLKLGRKVRYNFVKTNEIVDSLFEERASLTDDYMTFQDYQESEFLIIHHPKVWKRNKILWETLNYLCEIRKNNELPTIIITDANKLYDEHGSLTISDIIDFTNSNLCGDSNSMLSEFTGSSGGIYSD